MQTKWNVSDQDFSADSPNQQPLIFSSFGCHFHSCSIFNIDHTPSTSHLFCHLLHSLPNPLCLSSCM